MTVRDAMGVRGRPDCQRSHPGTLRECPGHGVHPGTLSAVLRRTACHRTAESVPDDFSVRDDRWRPRRLWRPGRVWASQDEERPRTKTERPRRLGRSGMHHLRPGRDTRPGTRTGVRDVRSVPGCSRAVPGRSVPGRVGASRNGKPVLGRGKSSQDARHHCETLKSYRDPTKLRC